MIVKAGSTDVTTYFCLRLSATGLEATGLTIANIDLQYCRSGAAPAAKVDATALAQTDTAHTDNYGIEIDATDQPGLYRIDWPDAAFAAGAREVILSAKCATCFTEHVRVELSPAVDAVAVGGTVQTGRDLGASVLVGDKTGFSLAAAPPTAADIKTALEAAGSHLALILADTGTDGVALTAAERTAIVAALKASTGWTAGGTATFATLLKILYAMARGKITVAAGVYTLYDDDGTTPLFTLAPGTGATTRATT